ncbi:MAG: hypothetical protein NTY09_05455 [bacterium]|nr:hypothetical protein [bacterium]
MYRRCLCTTSAVILVLIFGLMGCSGGGSGPTTPGLDGTDLGMPTSGPITANSYQPDRYLLGMGVMYMDPDNLTVEIEPLRTLGFHLNLLGWLEQQPGNNFFQLVAVSLSDHDSLLVDIRIVHPFPGMKSLTGRDMRAIMISPGVKIFPSTLIKDVSGNITQIYASRTLLNPDGFSTLWNRWTWQEVQHPQLMGYIRGKLVSSDEYTIPGNLHPFKEYCTDTDPIMRRVFVPNQSAVRQFDFALPAPGQPFSIAYAVDISWEVPLTEPVNDVINDFPITANCPEPYQISSVIVSNTLTKIGGSATVQFDVCDWQDATNFSHIQVEAPDLFYGAIEIDPNSHIMSPTPNSRRYEVVIGNAKGSAVTTNGGSDLLIAVEDADNSVVTPDLTAYNIFKLPVVDDPGFWRDRDGDGSWVNTPLESPYLVPSSLSTGQPDLAVFSYPQGAAQFFGPDPELLLFDDVNSRFIVWNRTLDASFIRSGYPGSMPPSWLLYPNSMDCNNQGVTAVGSTSEVVNGNYMIKHAMNMFTPYGVYGTSWSSGTWIPGNPSSYYETVRDVTAGMGNLFADPVYGLFAYESGPMPSVGHVVNVSAPWTDPYNANVFRVNIPLGNSAGVAGEMYYNAQRLRLGVDTDPVGLQTQWWPVYILESNPTPGTSELEGFRVNFSNLPTEPFWTVTDAMIKADFPGSYGLDCEVVPSYTKHVTLIGATTAQYNWVCVLMTDGLDYWLAFYDPLNPHPDNPGDSKTEPVYVTDKIALDTGAGMVPVAMDIDHQYFEVYVLLRDSADMYYITPFEFFY